MKQFAVIGLGRFGSSVARTLTGLGYDVLGIDKREAIVNSLAHELPHVVTGDAADEDTLRSLGIRNFDVVIVAIGNDLQASVLVTLTLKEFGVSMVVAKASTEIHGKVLDRVGADRVIFPERDMGVRVAHSLISSDVLDFIQLSPDCGIIEVSANPGFSGKTLREIDLRAQHGLTVLAIRRDGKVHISPGGDDVIGPSDVLVLVGQTEDLARYEKRLAR